MGRFQRWLWTRRDLKWRDWQRGLGQSGGSMTPVELFFDAPLRSAVVEYWDGGRRDVTDLAIHARVAYLTARWTFWLTISTGALAVTTVATLLYTVIREA
jgi:hypothetical protein